MTRVSKISELGTKKGDWIAANRLGFRGLARNIFRDMARSRNYMHSGRFRTRLGRARAARQKAARSYTVGKRRKSTSSGQGVTTQHDARLIYAKKRMPFRRRKRWRGFVKKVHAVAEKELGSQQVVFNITATFSNSVNGLQTLGEASLYSLNGIPSYFTDLKSIAGFIASADNTVAKGLALGPSSKVIFQSGVLDCTIRNASTNNGVAAYEARMEVDIYELVMRHSAEETGTIYGSLLSVLQTNEANTDAIGGVTGGVTDEVKIGYRGVTPFDLSYALSRFGISIYRKTKYQIANQDQITYQMRDPRRYSMVYKEIANQDGFNTKYTKCLLIIGKLAPGLTVGAVGTPGVYQEVLKVGLTRKYLYKVENVTEDRTMFSIS